MTSQKPNSDDFPEGMKPTPALSRSLVKLSRPTMIVLVLLIIGVASGLIPRFRQHAAVGAETAELSMPTVTVVSPKPGKPAVGMALPAEVKPWAEAPIHARVTGYLKHRHVDIGAHVEAGQLLAEIDTPELNQDLERARAQLAQTEASLGLATITANRWAGLLETASVSEQEAAEKQADLKLKTAVANSARAEARRLESLQAFSQVKAPFAGTVTVRNVDWGDLIVAAGSKEIFHLAQTQKLRVYAQVPQAMARGVAVGQAGEMILPELPGKTFPAKVIRTAGVMAPDSRTLLVELAADNPKGEILAGSYAQVRLIEAKMDVALTLPSNTILFRPEGPHVGVVQPDGKVELRKVKLGRDLGPAIEIVSGVTPSDRVITNPADSLISGVTVTISETPSNEKKL